MSQTQARWLEQMLAANADFKARIQPDKLPVARAPGAAVITCMDPRVNLEALGIPGFASDGAGASTTRVIRTIGGMAENRSLIVGLFLANIREIALVMHTDCGCCLAYSKIDTIIENMQKRLSPDAYATFKAEIGEPFREHLRAYLKAFADPYEAVQREIATIRELPFIPADMILHGLVYELSSGNVEVVVNGYEAN